MTEEELVSAKRGILMDMLAAILDDQKTTKPNVEVWKLHIDAALDRLDDLTEVESAPKTSK